MKSPKTLHCIASIGLFVLALALPNAAQADGPLEEVMEEMQSSYRLVGRALRKPAENLDTMLKVAQDMQLAAVKAKGMEVELPPNASSSDAAAYQKQYRVMMLQSILALVQFEEALLREDYDAAKVAWDAVRASKSDGHDKFKVE